MCRRPPARHRRRRRHPRSLRRPHRKPGRRPHRLPHCHRHRYVPFFRHNHPTRQRAKIDIKTTPCSSLSSAVTWHARENLMNDVRFHLRLAPGRSFRTSLNISHQSDPRATRGQASELPHRDRSSLCRGSDVWAMHSNLKPNTRCTVDSFTFRALHIVAVHCFRFISVLRLICLSSFVLTSSPSCVIPCSESKYGRPLLNEKQCQDTILVVLQMGTDLCITHCFSSYL